MAKKDFSNANTGRVYDIIETATAEQEDPNIYKRKPRRTYSGAETAEAMENMQTQGKKGMKAMRINMAFSPEIYQYIKSMSMVKGQTLTQFVNDILLESYNKNREEFEEIKALIKKHRSL